MIPSFAPRTPALSQLSFAAILLRLNSVDAKAESVAGTLGLCILTTKHYFGGIC